MASQRGFTSPNASIPALFRGWEVVPAGGGLSDPRNEHSCSFRGCEVLEAGRRWVEPRKRAVVLGFGGRGTVVAAREEPDPRKRAFLLGFGVGKWCWQTVGCQIPETSNHAHFGDVCWRQAEGGQNPGNKQSCSASGFGGWL